MPVLTLPQKPTNSKGFVKSVELPKDPISALFMGTNVNTDIMLGKEDENDKPNRFAVGNTERPTDITYRVTMENNWWFMYARMYQYRQEVSVLSTIVSRSVDELTRYGFIWEPNFAKKCMNPKCGYEAKTMIDKCPICGGTEFRRPEAGQPDRYFVRSNGKSFMDEANNSGQSLKDVIRSYAEMEYLCNQAYLLCVAGDQYDTKTGLITKDKDGNDNKYPLEFLALDPVKVQILFDDSGTPGRTKAFTMEDRHRAYDIIDDINELKTVTEKGLALYPAAYKVGENLGAAGQAWYYTMDEIYQDHWFRASLTYGIPTWFDIDDDLQTFHYLEKHFLKKYKFGYVRKILVLPGFGDDAVEEITKGITDVLATNDNSIPIVCTPPQLSGVAEMRAQTLDLGTENSNDALAVKNDIRDRLCAHIGVPNLFAGDVEQSGGMNNESQQITVYDRYLMGKMAFIDRLCAWIQSWFPQITDWTLKLDRPTKAMADAKRRLDKIQEAQQMKQMGFKVYLVDGEFRYSEQPLDQEQMEQQQEQAEAQQAGGAGGLEAMLGGVLPGDGDGPPEQGTARREDADINASKDEIEQSMREAL